MSTSLIHFSSFFMSKDMATAERVLRTRAYDGDSMAHTLIRSCMYVGPLTANWSPPGSTQQLCCLAFCFCGSEPFHVLDLRTTGVVLWSSSLSRARGGLCGDGVTGGGDWMHNETVSKDSKQISSYNIKLQRRSLCRALI